METAFKDLFENPCIWASFCSWLVAQFAKMICGFLRTRRFDFSYLVSTGGMPSAHSAMAWGLCMAVGLMSGFTTPVFAVAFGFASVTVFDAATVRRAAGQQARLMNDMIDELFREHHFSERKLAELLGHTRLEVFMGILIGLLTAVIVTSMWVCLGTPTGPYFAALGR